MANNYSSELVESIKGLLGGRNWEYTFDVNHGIFQIRSGLDSSVQSCTVYIHLRSDGISSIGKISIDVMEARQSAIAEFITRINYKLKDGSFQMDYSDGEVRFKMYMNCGETIPSADSLERLFVIPFIMWEKYGNAFLSVLFANVEPRIALSQESKISSEE